MNKTKLFLISLLVLVNFNPKAKALDPNAGTDQALVNLEDPITSDFLLILLSAFLGELTHYTAKKGLKTIKEAVCKKENQPICKDKDPEYLYTPLDTGISSIMGICLKDDLLFLYRPEKEKTKHILSFYTDSLEVYNGYHGYFEFVSFVVPKNFIRIIVAPTALNILSKLIRFVLNFLETDIVDNLGLLNILEDLNENELWNTGFDARNFRGFCKKLFISYPAKSIKKLKPNLKPEEMGLPQTMLEMYRIFEENIDFLTLSVIAAIESILVVGKTSEIAKNFSTRILQNRLNHRPWIRKLSKKSLSLTIGILLTFTIDIFAIQPASLIICGKLGIESVKLNLSRDLFRHFMRFGLACKFSKIFTGSAEQEIRKLYFISLAYLLMTTVKNLAYSMGIWNLAGYTFTVEFLGIATLVSYAKIYYLVIVPYNPVIVATISILKNALLAAPGILFILFALPLGTVLTFTVLKIIDDAGKEFLKPVGDKIHSIISANARAVERRFKKKSKISSPKEMLEAVGDFTVDGLFLVRSIAWSALCSVIWPWESSEEIEEETSKKPSMSPVPDFFAG